MDFLKSVYNFLNGTNNAVEFIWESDYTVVNCLWKIYSVFKEFGEIKNIKMQPPLSRLFTVEFTTHQVASAVLLKQRIKIENHEIIVKPCKREYFPAEISQKVKVDDILLQPPDQESPTNILNILHDDCLYEIFKRVHPSKYYIIADVCVKFNQVITEILAKKHQKTVFSIDDMQLLTLSEADHYLRYFGSSIYQAEITGFRLKSANRLKIKIILRMISEHCVNLRYFSICGWELEEETVNEIIPLFMRLERLHFQTHGEPCSIFLPSINCPKLVAIKCSDWNIYSRENQFPSLFNFLYHNTQLTSFWYYGNARQSCKDLHLPMNNSLFGRFKSLKSLTIINTWKNFYKPKHPIDEQLLKVTELMQELSIKKVPIEILKLVYTLIDDATIEYIAQIKTMKKFIFFDFNFYFPSSCALSRDVIESYIIRLESGLPNLEFLQFQTCFYIDIVFRDEHIKLIENDLKIIRSLEPSEIKLNMHQFDRNAFNDKYNLKTIQNTYTQNRSIYSMSKVNWELRLTIRKFPAIDLNMQRYWLTLCYIDEDRHASMTRFPMINKWSQPDFHPKESRIF